MLLLDQAEPNQLVYEGCIEAHCDTGEKIVQEQITVFAILEDRSHFLDLIFYFNLLLFGLVLLHIRQ